MPKTKHKLKSKQDKKPKIQQNKPKLPILAKIVAVLLIIFALQVLILVFTFLYLHFFAGYPIPQDVSWQLNLLFQFAIAVILIIISIYLFKRKNLARILAIIALFLISILNLRAEIFLADSPSPISLIMYSLFLIAALYLLFSRKVKKAFS